MQSELFKTAEVDIREVVKLVETLKGHEVVIRTFNPGWTNLNIYDDFLEGAQAIQKAVKVSGVKD